MSAPLAPTPRPTATPDPFTWTRYDLGADVGTIYLPSTWARLGGGKYLGHQISIAAAPGDPARGLNEQPVLGFVARVTGPVPFTDIGLLADYLRQTTYAQTDAQQSPGTHPSGPVMFFKYAARSGPDAAIVQETDAVFVRGGIGLILGLRSPVDDLRKNAPLFQNIFQRFTPG